MVNGLGSAREAALAGLVPVAAAPVLTQPAARTARPTTAAAAARRVVIRSMVAPRVSKVAMDAKPPRRPPASGLPAGQDCGQHGNNGTPAVPQSGHATPGAQAGEPGTHGDS